MPGGATNTLKCIQDENISWITCYCVQNTRRSEYWTSCWLKVSHLPEKTLKEKNTKTLNKSCRNLPIVVLIVCFGTIPAQINVTDDKDWHLLLHIVLQNPQSVSSLPTLSTEGWIWPLAGVGVLEKARLHLMQAHFKVFPIAGADY